MNFLRSFATLMLVLSLFGVFTSITEGATPLEVPGTYATIQLAIDAAVSGDIINVAAGTYIEALNIPVGTTNLEIAGADKTTTIIKGTVTTAQALSPLAESNIHILASGVKLHGFTIESPDYIVDKYTTGILIGAGSIEIYDNIFKVFNAIDMDGGEVSQAIVTYLASSLPGVDISGLNIHDNAFIDLAPGPAGYEGIYINRDTGVGAITIQNNTFTGDLLRAVTNERPNALITGNTVSTDLVPGLPGGYIGIYAGDGTGTGFSDITISNNTVDGPGAGGFLEGIRIASTAQGDAPATLSNIVVTGNIITGNAIGFRTKIGPGVTVSNNNINGNTTSVDNSDPNSGTLNASTNWLGSFDPATVSGAMVNPNTIDFTPLLESGTDTDGGTAGFQPDFTSSASFTVHALGQQSGAVTI